MTKHPASWITLITVDPERIWICPCLHASVHDHACICVHACKSVGVCAPHCDGCSLKLI